MRATGEDRKRVKKFRRHKGRMWLRTGDLGKMDDEGYFHFYDRKRDMIKYKVIPSLPENRRGSENASQD